MTAANAMQNRESLVKDFRITTQLYEDGMADLILNFKGSGKGSLEIELSLCGEVVLHKSSILSEQSEIHSIIENVKCWSAETPVLYDLVITVVNNRKSLSERIQRKVGFGYVEMKNGAMFLNGKRLRLAAADDIELSAFEDTLRENLSELKKNRINTVKISNMTELEKVSGICDEIGMYILPEADLCHVTEMYMTAKNHVSVIAWAVGESSEAKKAESIGLLKKLDDTRPVLA